LLASLIAAPGPGSPPRTPADDALIVLKGNVSQKDLYRVDLTTGYERQLTRLGRELSIGDFDLSRDGRQIIFDRIREESDIVLFNLVVR
jgi:hypothetical protein